MSFGIAFVNNTLIYWCSCNLLIIFQIYLERVYFLGCCWSGSWMSLQNLIKISAQKTLIKLSLEIVRACYIACLARLRVYKFACLMCSHAYMLSVPACLGARVFSMLVCFMSLRAHISYKLAVLKYLTCLRAWYPSLTGVWQGSKCASKEPFKKYLINEGGGKFTKKSDEKWNRGWVWCQTIFAAHFFWRHNFCSFLFL